MPGILTGNYLIQIVEANRWGDGKKSNINFPREKHYVTLHGIQQAKISTPNSLIFFLIVWLPKEMWSTVTTAEFRIIVFLSIKVQSLRLQWGKLNSRRKKFPGLGESAFQLRCLPFYQSRKLSMMRQFFSWLPMKFKKSLSFIVWKLSLLSHHFDSLASSINECSLW